MTFMIIGAVVGVFIIPGQPHGIAIKLHRLPTEQ